MKMSEAMVRADELRPNTFTDEMKAKWLFDLDMKLAEFMEVPEPVFEWPEVDAVLLMPEPHDNIYLYYLCAMIDYYNHETNIYINDNAVFEEALSEAKAHWIRHHRTKRTFALGNWRTM